MVHLMLKRLFQMEKDKNVDMVLFSNPNNPTGHSITLSEMKKISEAFKDIPVIFDEA